LAGNSRVTKETDRNGRVIEHFYDQLGRQTSEQWKTNTGVLQQTLNFAYDARGRLQSASDASATYSYTYDNWDRTLQSSRSGTPCLTHAWRSIDGRLWYPTRMSDYRRYFVAGGTFFFTVVTERRAHPSSRIYLLARS
jgi:YD repeat-containing protein